MTEKEHKVGEYIPLPKHWGGVDFDIKTAPSQRTWVGLTEAQCGVLWKTNMTPFEYYQAIEAKLKEKNT